MKKSIKKARSWKARMYRIPNYTPEFDKYDMVLGRPLGAQYFHGLPVVVDNNKIDSNLEEGFWHIVTRKKNNDRLIDYKRARRLPWLKPLIESSQDPDILRWEEEELDRRRGRMIKNMVTIQVHSQRRTNATE